MSLRVSEITRYHGLREAAWRTGPFGHDRNMTAWIDTHCHLDAGEFAADRDAVRGRARAAGVSRCVIPAVAVHNFGAVRELAHRHGDAYALGIHPICTP